MRKIPPAIREEQLNSLPGMRFMRWLDSNRNSRSKILMRCDIGHEWVARVSGLIHGGRGCPHCSERIARPAEERIEQLNSLPGKFFVRWESNYRNYRSKAVMRCDIGHEWSASIHNLTSGRGCPVCAVQNRTHSAEEREMRLNALPNMQFVRWLNIPDRNFSKAVMRCDIGHEWSANFNNLTSHKSGCPFCSKHGFDKSKHGTLYALCSSDGAHIKIGVSTRYKRRINELRRETPFEFSIIGLIHAHGLDVLDLESMFHNNFKSAGLLGFNGATEWLKFDPQILSLLRILGA